MVVFSLGSIAKSNTMTPEIKAAFQDAFAEIPQRVIWKFDDSIENLSKNVLLMKWMPQRDILGEVGTNCQENLDLKTYLFSYLIHIPT